ncbi:hypothetical protein FHS55_000876 [Angulomicrobium tetraedrale]|uniref:Uncharacterized protein n=1 Tax=Ancylobacter tetraedralis TaxID=217068 RepID=A0A839Z6S3_9HYPH|nr:hypothetical protein [Ancylobacter tetraedralis]MBB3770290.1 hypothetical protein [Ancylobacter tetraedralis]
MSKLIFPAVAATFVLAGAMLSAQFALSDTVAVAAGANAAMPQGYRTCFMERRLVSTGQPRIEMARRCVFDE